jgi:hypothetical protein
MAIEKFVSIFGEGGVVVFGDIQGSQCCLVFEPGGGCKIMWLVRILNSGYRDNSRRTFFSGILAPRNGSDSTRCCHPHEIIACFTLMTCKIGRCSSDILILGGLWRKTVYSSMYQQRGGDLRVVLQVALEGEEDWIKLLP